MGGELQRALTSQVTHLVAERPGSDKYKVAVAGTCVRSRCLYYCIHVNALVGPFLLFSHCIGLSTLRSSCFSFLALTLSQYFSFCRRSLALP